MLMAAFSGCSSGKTGQIGIKAGHLSPCPDTPNCVSSQSEDVSHFIEPLRYEGSVADAKKVLISVVQSMKRTRIVSEERNYLHVECTTAVFRFVDDIEFLMDDPKKIIHIRSASRIGYSDLGVNRRRVERIRKRFQALYLKI